VRKPNVVKVEAAVLVVPQASLNGHFTKSFMDINYHATSSILLMWQSIYEEREARLSSYVRGVSSP
jgi:hypothetical protein